MKVRFYLLVAALIFCSPSLASDCRHTNSNYKYEYRTGCANNYNYNYDVSGEDEDGNEVSGNLTMEGNDGQGAGTIEDEEGNEIDVTAQWIGGGNIEATDDDGNTYELNVDDRF